MDLSPVPALPRIVIKSRIGLHSTVVFDRQSSHHFANRIALRLGHALATTQLAKLLVAGASYLPR